VQKAARKGAPPTSPDVAEAAPVVETSQANVAVRDVFGTGNDAARTDQLLAQMKESAKKSDGLTRALEEARLEVATTLSTLQTRATAIVDELARASFAEDVVARLMPELAELRERMGGPYRWHRAAERAVLARLWPRESTSARDLVEALGEELDAQGRGQTLDDAAALALGDEIAVRGRAAHGVVRLSAARIRNERRKEFGDAIARAMPGAALSQRAARLLGGAPLSPGPSPTTPGSVDATKQRASDDLDALERLHTALVGTADSASKKEPS
jgi:hypothetical protein